MSLVEAAFDIHNIENKIPDGQEIQGRQNPAIVTVVMRIIFLIINIVRAKMCEHLLSTCFLLNTGLNKPLR